MNTKIKNILIFLSLFIISIIIIGSVYYHEECIKQDFDLIIYSFTTGVEHSAPDIVKKIIFTCLVPVIALTLALFIPTLKDKNANNESIVDNNGPIKTYRQKDIIKNTGKYILILFILSMIFFVKVFGVDDFVKNKIQKTKLFEQYYVDHRDVSIEFPEEKRNLIIIIAESMETTVCSRKNGGGWEYSVIPELEKIALENTNFSNSEKLGGAYQTHGIDYSAGGNVAITAGIPLKTVDILYDKNEYTGKGKYLEGAYTLGELLQEYGYNLEIIMGSEGTFGGREQYYKTNGNYKIFDLKYAIENGKMKSEDKAWWGFEDDKLFEWSKEEITTLAQKEEPFNFIMLTADTHFPDGYLSKNVENKYDTQYENVQAYSSKSIYNFIEWLKKQDFYENTTIVIIGDHLSMQQESFYEGKMENNYERTIYNAIINSKIEATNNKNRKFTTMDMFPTILASIGVKIEGERLGLGTNLYSGEPTLLEMLGYDTLNNELKKSSKFYNRVILGNDYYYMKLQTNSESEE